jgi:nicotinate-nucleotide pyrophosphorylase (carboxylating)
MSSTIAVLDADVIADAVARALAEDIGDGDVTAAATIGAAARGRALITQKAPGVVFGLQLVEASFRALDPEVAIEPLTVEGAWREGGPALRAEGAARALVTGERTALNFLARLSGIATMAARFCAAIDGTGAQLLDTRKTTPGLRVLEKAAVAAGGGTNHRRGLYDAILIKENHAALAGGVAEAVKRARSYAEREGVRVEVECRSLEEVQQALTAGATRILLDNFSVRDLSDAVTLAAGAAELEASGGVTLETAREIAATGVDFVSVGALTHSAPALDFSMIVEPLEP